MASNRVEKYHIGGGVTNDGHADVRTKVQHSISVAPLNGLLHDAPKLFWIRDLDSYANEIYRYSGESHVLQIENVATSAGV
jgi:hypothetical protein